MATLVFEGNHFVKRVVTVNKKTPNLNLILGNYRNNESLGRLTEFNIFSVPLSNMKEMTRGESIWECHQLGGGKLDSEFFFGILYHTFWEVIWCILENKSAKASKIIHLGMSSIGRTMDQYLCPKMK